MCVGCIFYMHELYPNPYSQIFRYCARKNIIFVDSETQLQFKDVPDFLRSLAWILSILRNLFNRGYIDNFLGHTSYFMAVLLVSIVGEGSMVKLELKLNKIDLV